MRLGLGLGLAPSEGAEAGAGDASDTLGPDPGELSGTFRLSLGALSL